MVAGGQHAVLWRHGQLIDLGTLAGTFSVAKAINDRGQIVGYSQLPNGVNHAFMWENGVLTDLGEFIADGIDEHGDIVGAAVETGTTRAVLWRDGQMTLLPTPSGALASEAMDINERGQVLLYYTDSPFSSRAALVDLADGTVTDLGLPAGETLFIPQHLNDHGEVVGIASQAAVVWRAGHFATLPGLTPTGSARTHDINNYGQAVGSADTGVETHATLWTNCL